MKVLVTGSSGNIGSAVAAYVSNHAQVVGLDIRPGEWTTQLGSIEDVAALKKVVPGVDAIIHCAAFLTPHVGNVPDSRFAEVNVNGTANLLNLAVQHRVARFVFTSTTSVYGCSTRDKTEAVWVTESLEPNAEDIYDRTKLEAESLCQAASLQGLHATVMRMSRCFPEPDHLMGFYRLYRGVSRADVAQAHWQGVTAALSKFEIFNISGDTPFHQDDCPALLTDPWSIIEKAFPGSIEMYDQLGWEKPASIDRVYVIDKAKEILGYSPNENFREFLDNHR